MPFTQLGEVKRPRFVIDQILSSIQDGSLAAGERLPSEAKLAELTGVGRTSVREALAALRLMGVVETRVGDGSYIAAAGASGNIHENTAREIASAISQSNEARQLQEARAVFECGLVRLAAARWSAEKAEAFESLFDRMADAAERECYTDYVGLHRDFHLELARATDNPIVEQTEKSFLDYMDHEGWRDMEEQSLLPNQDDVLRASVTEHRVIVDAIDAGDGNLASELMHDHFSRHEEGEE